MLVHCFVISNCHFKNKQKISDTSKIFANNSWLKYILNNWTVPYLILVFQLFNPLCFPLFCAQFKRQLHQCEDLVFICDIRAFSCPPLSFHSIQGKFPRHFRVDFGLYGLYLLRREWYSIFVGMWCWPRWYSVEQNVLHSDKMYKCCSPSA